jgi:hypothetical protein
MTASDSLERLRLNLEKRVNINNLQLSRAISVGSTAEKSCSILLVSESNDSSESG